MNVVYVYVHPPEKVQEIIDAAYDLASERTANPSEWPHVFNAACALMSAGQAIVQQPQTVDLAALDLSNGRRR
jgi:hypothetical protein